MSLYPFPPAPEFLQAVLEKLDRFGEALNALRLPVETILLHIATEVLHHLAEAPQALRGQEGENGVRIFSRMAGVHEFIGRPHGHAHVVQRLAKFAKQRALGSLAGLEMAVQRT